MVCSKGNCWQVAQNAAGFPSDALIDDIRVSICIDNSIAPSNPLLTVSAQSRHAFACSALCRMPHAPRQHMFVLTEHTAQGDAC